MKNAFLKLGAWAAVLPILFIPASVFAAGAVTPGLSNASSNLTGTGIASGAGIGTGAQDLPTLIGKIIGVLLGVMGIILVIYIIIAGITYMTAAGEDTKVKKAKAMIQTSVIGIIIIVAAYSISAFVISQITAVGT